MNCPGRDYWLNELKNELLDINQNINAIAEIGSGFEDELSTILINEDSNLWLIAIIGLYTLFAMLCMALKKRFYDRTFSVDNTSL